MTDVRSMTPNEYKLLTRAETAEYKLSQAPVLGAAAHDVLAERRRQIEKEGWTIEHDDSHVSGEMAMAAAVYALTSFLDTEHSRNTAFARYWPWDRSWFKPAGGRRDLVRAAALILAEIERLDRVACTLASQMRATQGE